MGYKDIIIAQGTISASPQYQSVLGVYVINNYYGLTSNHVLLNDTLPEEITEDVTWTTEDVSGGRGRLYFLFANPIHFDNEVTATYVLGIPDN